MWQKRKPTPGFKENAAAKKERKESFLREARSFQNSLPPRLREKLKRARTGNGTIVA